MQVYSDKTKRLRKKRVQLPEDLFGTPTWPPFHCFGTPVVYHLPFGFMVWVNGSQSSGLVNFVPESPLPFVQISSMYRKTAAKA